MHAHHPSTASFTQTHRSALLALALLGSSLLGAFSVQADDGADVQRTAAVKPSAPVMTAAPVIHIDLASAKALTETGKLLEAKGEYAAAVTAYRTAAENGSGEAAVNLAALMISDKPQVHRDYVASVHWYAKARELGVNVDALDKRTMTR